MAIFNSYVKLPEGRVKTINYKVGYQLRYFFHQLEEGILNELLYNNYKVVYYYRWVLFYTNYKVWD